MSRNLLVRYIWLIDTIRRYGAITREKLNELWMLSPYSDGNPMPRRTFYNYRAAIEELFNINIECNAKTYEYYIDSGDSHQASVTDWLLNSAAMSNVLSSVSDVSDRIFLEDVPSARLYLSQVVSALREHHPLRFTYRPYTRVNPTRDVVIEPYFLKIFRQRWYVTGLNSRDGVVKTYALDRMEDVVIEPDTLRAVGRLRPRELREGLLRDCLLAGQCLRRSNPCHFATGQVSAGASAPPFAARGDS